LTLEAAVPLERVTKPSSVESPASRAAVEPLWHVYGCLGRIAAGQLERVGRVSLDPVE